MQLQVLALLAVLCSGAAGKDHDWSISCDFVYHVNCADFGVEPLCASDGNTYDNECFFAQSHCVFPDVKKVHDGACGQSAAGTTASGTVASHIHTSGISPPGTTAQPRTTISSHTVTFAFCHSLQPVVCAPDHRLVCGSDGFTYHGMCHFERAKCRHRHLHVVKLGACSD